MLNEQQKVSFHKIIIIKNAYRKRDMEIEGRESIIRSIAQRLSVNNIFLNILKNVQESTCVGVFFDKVIGLKPAT